MVSSNLSLDPARPGYVRIPQNLDSVCVRDQENEAPGTLSAKSVESIWQSTLDLYRSGAYPALGICIRHKGEIVLNRTLGHARGNGPLQAPETPKTLLTPQTPVCIFSASKAITAVLTLKLAEDGGIALHDRVSRHIPEFAQHGKDRITIEEVLSHRGGFPLFDIPRSEIHPEILLDWDRCVAMICDAPPTHRRHRRLSYHALTGGYILAEIIQRVTGETLRSYHDRKLRKPLGMTHFTFGLPEPHREEAAHNYMAGAKVNFLAARFLQSFLMLPMDEVVDISNSPAFMEAVVPAGNMFCTSEELSRFYQLLLNDGYWQGEQVLQPDTVDLLRKPVANLSLDLTLKIPMRYSLGLMLGGNPIGMFGPMTGQAFGHIGMMNVLGWADPARDLSAALLVTGKAFMGGHVIALAKWQARVARECRS